MFNSILLDGFVSFGDNCEFGFVQDLAQSKEGNLLRWAVTKPHALIAGLRSRFRDLLKFENIVPHSTDMIYDKQSCISFHSNMLSVLNDSKFEFVLPEAERRIVHASEMLKFDYMREKLIEQLRNASKIFVYKCNDGVSFEDLMCAASEIRNYNSENIVLYLSATENTKLHGTVDCLSTGLYIGYTDRFAPYHQSENASVAMWVKILNRLVVVIPKDARQRIFGAALCSIAMASSLDRQRYDQPTEAIQEFDDAIGQNKYDAASLIINTAIVSYPEHSTVWKKAAMLDMWSGRWQDAAAKYALIMHVFPEESDAYLWAAKTLYMNGHSSLAKTLYESRWENFDQESESTWSVGCEIYFACSDWINLEKFAYILSIRFPHIPWAQNWLATAQINMGLIDQSICSIRKSIDAEEMSYDSISTIAATIILQTFRTHSEDGRLDKLIDFVLRGYANMAAEADVPHFVGSLHSLNYREPHEFERLYDVLQSRCASMPSFATKSSFVCQCLGLGSAEVNKSLILGTLLTKRTEFLQHVFSSASHHSRNVANLLSAFKSQEMEIAFSELSNESKSRWTILLSALDPGSIKVYSALRSADTPDSTPISNYIALPNRALSRNPKIAVCISGQLRGFRRAFPSWLDAGLHPDNPDISFFVHAWNRLGAKKPYYVHSSRSFPEHFGNAFYSAGQILGQAELEQRYSSLFEAFTQNRIVSSEEVQDVYKTTHVVLEDDIAPNFSSLSNAHKMYYKAESAWSMINDVDEAFDLIVRIRPDQMLASGSNFDFPELLSSSSLDRKLFTKTGVYLDSSIGVGMDDQFAIGEPNVMTIYSTAFSQTLSTSSALFGYFDRNPRFIGHVNFCAALLAGGFTAEAISGVNFGSFADPVDLSNEEIRNLILIDLVGRHADHHDEKLLAAVSTNI